MLLEVVSSGWETDDWTRNRDNSGKLDNNPSESKVVVKVKIKCRTEINCV